MKDEEWDGPGWYGYRIEDGVKVWHRFLTPALPHEFIMAGTAAYHNGLKDFRHLSHQPHYQGGTAHGK